MIPYTTITEADMYDPFFGRRRRRRRLRQRRRNIVRPLLVPSKPTRKVTTDPKIRKKPKRQTIVRKPLKAVPDIRKKEPQKKVTKRIVKTQNNIVPDPIRTTIETLIEGSGITKVMTPTKTSNMKKTAIQKPNPSSQRDHSMRNIAGVGILLLGLTGFMAYKLIAKRKANGRISQ